MGFSIAEMVRDNARRRPEAVALREAGRAMSYGALGVATRRAAAALERRGVRRGDRVAFIAPNSIAWVVTCFGIHEAGAVPVPLNPLLAVPEIEGILRDCEPALLVAVSSTLEKARSAAASLGIPVLDHDARDLEAEPSEWSRQPSDGSPDDTAVVLYTSGTTGRPKGVELSHFNVFWNAQLFARDLLRLTPSDRCLAVMPLSHVSGHTCALAAALFAGASVTLMERFDPPEVLRTLARDRITIFLGVPAMFWALLEVPTPQGCDLGALRGCTSGGQALPVDVHRAFEARFGVEIAEGYGMTEASPNITTNLLDGSKRIGTVGPAVWGVSIRVVDDAGRDVAPGERGEVIARGPGVMKGYFRNPEATADAIRGGWLRTGDIGVLDSDGYLSIVDRRKELIVTGGYNVYPREVEDVLYAHPDVLEAAVVAWPDPKLGERPVAHVAPKPGRTFDVDALREHCAQRVARYKVPREFLVVRALPKGPTGKIDRLQLKRAGFPRQEEKR